MMVVAMAATAKRKVSKTSDRDVPPVIPPISLEKSRQISKRGKKLLIERYVSE